MYSTYNAKDWAASFDGVNITGFSEEIANGKKDEDFFTPSVGAQGDVVSSEINNDLGEVTITLQRTSPSVPYLKNCARKGVTAPLWCNNLKLKETFGGELARIKNYPEIVAAAEAEDLKFVFAVFDYRVK